jgi:hypothetical protein
LEEAMMNGHSVLLRIMHKLWNFPAFIPFWLWHKKLVNCEWHHLHWHGHSLVIINSIYIFGTNQWGIIKKFCRYSLAIAIHLLIHQSSPFMHFSVWCLCFYLSRGRVKK